MQGIFWEKERFQFDGNLTWGKIRINQNPREKLHLNFFVNKWKRKCA